ncbi:MAG: cytochrome c oxidase subunit 3 [Paracoccus sp. (in: a-proteobacteria)]|nr:cytochrome c oxidase subunit 3 [Paracoccus sp. (in: a-proteobacteria)]
MSGRRAPTEELPGELILWVLIISEIAVFAVGLWLFLALRLHDPAMFATGRAELHPIAAGINTVVLVSSGYAAARAHHACLKGAPARAWLLLAAGLGAVFIAIKAFEYGDLFSRGIGIETNVFFTFYFLLTGFHAAHVIAGMIILLIVAIRPQPQPVQAGAQFWHMVDLVWMLLLPVVYLMG